MTALFLLAAMLPISSGSPAAAASGACTTSKGVTVVVNFGPLGGGTVVRCAQSGGSGLDALHAAGFSSEGTQRYGNAFVCRLNGKPTAAAEKCSATPPIDKSWRYFYADNGGSWKYSQSGAANHTVIQGGFEGWSFGGGSTPGVAPVRSGSSGGSTGSGGGISDNPDAAPTGPSSTQDKALPQPKPRTGKTAATAPTATPSTPDPVADPASSADSNNTAQGEEGGNSVAPWIAGALILALVAALVITQRRRSARHIS